MKANESSFEAALRSVFDHVPAEGNYDGPSEEAASLVLWMAHGSSNGHSEGTRHFTMGSRWNVLPSWDAVEKTLDVHLPSLDAMLFWVGCIELLETTWLDGDGTLWESDEVSLLAMRALSKMKSVLLRHAEHTGLCAKDVAELPVVLDDAPDHEKLLKLVRAITSLPF